MPKQFDVLKAVHNAAGTTTLKKVGTAELSATSRDWTFRLKLPGIESELVLLAPREFVRARLLSLEMRIEDLRQSDETAAAHLSTDELTRPDGRAPADVSDAAPFDEPDTAIESAEPR